MVEVGCIDINTKVSLLSSYLAMLRLRHSEAVLHVMDYLKLKHNLQLAFDLTYPNIDKSNFWGCD